MDKAVLKQHFQCSLFLLFGLLLLPTVVFGQESVYQFPPGEDVYFRSDHMEGRSYIKFRSNGTYQRIVREHMFTQEDDNGTWKQDAAGLITMVSKRHVRSINAGGMTIHLLNYTPEVEEERVRQLPALIDDIKNFLKARPEKRNFLPEDVENIRRLYDMGLIRVDDNDDLVSRQQLEELLKGIELFINGNDKNSFYVTPMLYQNLTFLLWKNSEVPMDRDLDWIKNEIDSTQDGEEPQYLFMQIYKEIFDEETATTQPFIFYPEMNDAMKLFQE